MKKAIVAFTAILMFNCGTDQIGCTLYTYTIRNESGKNITIKANSIGFPNNPPVVTNLPVGEKLTKTYRACPPAGRYDFTDFFQGDLITITFENLKTQKYDIFDGLKCDQNALFRSPFCERQTSDVTFIFTAQDYENAQDCNGNCN